MKTSRSIVFTAILACAAILGCAFSGGCVSVPVLARAGQTNYVESVQTNWTSVTNYTTNIVVVSVAQTNASGVVIAAPVLQPQVIPEVQLTAHVSTNLTVHILPPVYYTNVSLASGITDTAQAIGNVVPVPGAGAATSGILAVLGAGFGIFNEFRRRNAVAAADGANSKAQTWQTAASTLVDNVETLRQAAMKVPGYTPAIDNQVMRVIQASHAEAGVATEIHGLVTAQTSNAAPPEFTNRPTAEDLMNAALGKIPVGSTWNKYEVQDVAMLKAQFVSGVAAASPASV